MTALWNADIHVIRRQWGRSGHMQIKAGRQQRGTKQSLGVLRKILFHSPKLPLGTSLSSTIFSIRMLKEPTHHLTKGCIIISLCIMFII